MWPGRSIAQTPGVLLFEVCRDRPVGQRNLRGAGAANERSTFLAADCEEYSPAEQFDVIVFNEVLCCLRDPLRTVERYARSAEPRWPPVGVIVHGRARQCHNTVATQASVCDRR